MNWYKYAANIKIGLFILGIILILIFVIITQSIVKDLREDNREIVRVYAEIVAGVVGEESSDNLNFIFENIILKVRFPLILSDLKKVPQTWRNIPNNPDDPDKLLKIRYTMDEQNEPIPLIYKDSKTNEELIYGYLHFGDSVLINRLKWLPILQIGLVGLFILLGFVAFSVIRNSEKRHIWAGMARETAHQLGTPVSALMGWIDLLKSHPQKSTKIISEIETDLARLEQISNRFGDMGRQAKLSKLDLIILINSVMNYLQRRIPNADIEFQQGDLDNAPIEGNENLLSWAIENIIKNGIDASKNKLGRIEILLQNIDNKYVISVKDYGKGIPKKDWKNIFRPGFSTKKYGWGLGLSLTKRIIQDLHKGKINVKNSEIDKGTMIQITLMQSAQDS